MGIDDLAGTHIAVVISSLGAGGAERVIALLSRHWLAAGAQVTVIAFDHPTQPIYHRFDERVRFRRLGIGNRERGAVLRRVAALRAEFRRLRPDVAISFLTKINALALGAAIGTGVPVIATERNNPERQSAHALWRLGLAGLYLRAKATVCQTDASRRCLPRLARGRSIVIGNPIEAPPRAGDRDGLRRLVAVGRLESQKGFDLLLEAFAGVSRRHPGWMLEIWGEGPDRPALQARVDGLGLNAHATLRGVSPQPGGWAVQADAFVLSSRYEGFPNVLGEAMAAGLPVVSTNCDFGPADLVEPEVTGLLVPADDAAALAAGIDRLLGDEALRLRLGDAARQSMARFAVDQVAAQWHRLLIEVLRRHVSPVAPRTIASRAAAAG